MSRLGSLLGRERGSKAFSFPSCCLWVADDDSAREVDEEAAVMAGISTDEDA